MGLTSCKLDVGVFCNYITIFSRYTLAVRLGLNTNFSSLISVLYCVGYFKPGSHIVSESMYLYIISILYPKYVTYVICWSSGHNSPNSRVLAHYLNGPQCYNSDPCLSVFL
jgi:hypothetical protein